MFLLQRDVGKYSTDYLYSTDSALLGVRGLYNFGADPRVGPASPEEVEIMIPESSSGAVPSVGVAAAGKKAAGPKGRFSAGAEVYYGLLNKSGGVSTGIRFTTLPGHTGFPYTMTLTLNPLMGNLSSTYAVKASSSLALCSRFDFNVYSYESELQLGMELWRRRRKSEDDLEWVYRKLKTPGIGGWGESVVSKIAEPAVQGLGLGSEAKDDKDTSGVLKARVNQDWGIGLLWEGRVKELLYTCGLVVDLRRREQIFRGVGLEVQYSS